MYIIIQYIKGQYIGVELQGIKVSNGNNGEFKGKKYFDAKPKQGLFLKNDNILRYTHKKSISYIIYNINIEKLICIYIMTKDN